jgi:serine protease AprX
MPIEIPCPLVEFILLGPVDDRRQLQDTPILGDVWVRFAKDPDKPLDLLITPYMTLPAGVVASALQERFVAQADPAHPDPRVSYVQGIVAARLHFRELLCTVVPMTYWFADRFIRDQGNIIGHQLEAYGRSQAAPGRALEAVKAAIRAAKRYFKASDESAGAFPKVAIDRYAVLTAIILWAAKAKSGAAENENAPIRQKILDLLDTMNPEEVAEELAQLVAVIGQDKQPEKPLIWQISCNRAARLALVKSIPAVKADAAKNLFQVDCKDIGWAVLDCGIDSTHPAFSNAVGGRPRIRKCFDFTKYRDIVNLSNTHPDIRKKNRQKFLKHKNNLALYNETEVGERRGFAKKIDDYMNELANDASRGKSVDWEIVKKFVEILPETPPLASHGTHVAGIIGASKAAADLAGPSADAADGMCPTIALYDFRVVGSTTEDTEFAVIAALQFIRFLNDRDNFLTIHGANLSLSIPHDVRNFACGNTPVCLESERLVESGVVVVAAAGNHGYKSFETKDGSFESYAAFSITDPGNADGVITVGATHRYWPHTYGISFFSSRGPTGDGRLKPDIVAPGERIRAPILGKDWGDLDGTSMAAPHVSGAAAMLMARYSELIGHPRRIKKILCETATDLGRERSFQGHGMLDVLRAFQSI